MKILFSNLDLTFTIDGLPMKAVNIVLEELTQDFPTHSHGRRCYEIHCISAGHGTVFINDKLYHVTPHTVYVTGPHIEHAQISDPKDPMLEYCLYITLPLSTVQKISQSKAAALFEKTAIWFGTDKYDIFPLLQKLFTELKYQQLGYISQAQALLTQIVVCLIRNYASIDPPPGAVLPTNNENGFSLTLEKAFLYEYADITLEELSSRLSLSARQTERLIHELYGKTFRQKKTEARMSAAALLLEDPDKTISSIAEELGYSSVEHFSTAFRRYYGKSASTYRHDDISILKS